MTPDQIEAERVMFENYVKSEHKGLSLLVYPGGIDGHYYYQATRNAWLAWLARAEIAMRENGHED